MAIMPGGGMEGELSSRIRYLAIPSPTRRFWYGAGFANTVLAMMQRAWSSLNLAWKVFQVRPSLVICSELDAWFVAVLAKLFLGSKVVADLREVYDDRALAFPTVVQSVVRHLLRALMKSLSRFTDEVIHVSEERRQAYSYLAKPGIVVGCYPELYDFEHIQRDRGADAGAAEAGEESVTAIHIGALRPTYASEQLLVALSLALQSVPNVKLTVLGGVSGHLRNGELMNSLIAGGALDLVEHVPHAEVVRRLRLSDVGISLVLPVDTTHYLAQPQKLYEYLAAGLPVVAADVPTIRRVLQASRCGLLVDPTSPTAIAHALVVLAEDAELRREMGENGLRAARAEFNWAAEAPKLIGVLESLDVCHFT